MKTSISKKVIHSYVSSAFGGLLSASVVCGIKGEKFNFPNAFIHSMKSATTLTSFPVAVYFLKRASPRYRALEESSLSDIKKQILTSTIGGAFATIMYTAINYPLTKLQDKLNNNRDIDISKVPREMVKTFTDRLGASIGFSVTMNTLQQIVPHFKNSLIDEIRGITIVHISGLNGKLLSYPIHKLKYGTTLSQMVKPFIKMALNTTIQCESIGLYKKQFTSLLE